ncbi:MAG TPA: nucleotidyl transferase AbiEii/AbiGii toxin family protein [Candidatus Portnoybacteria bacterium]|nr:nucleotidyl transferase AbiEii/AbiGii toxin family protein [Candidatus Portnoybacteria bacterium]
MLEFKEIKKYYSANEQNFPQLILKEYLQYKILDIIFSSQYGNRLIFMGGTAIRIVYGSDRFSEDLDLDNLDLTQKEFNKLMNHVKRELEKEGLEVELRNTFQNVYHCYLKFPRILFSNNLSPLKDEKIIIRVDSFRVSSNVGEVKNKIISKAEIFSEIKVYSSAVLLSQKIEALFNRKRSKGRDIYDVVYLFSLTEPDYNYLKKKVGISRKKELFTKMKKLFSDEELIILARDVKPFLINSKKVKQVEKFNLWLSSQIW